MLLSRLNFDLKMEKMECYSKITAVLAITHFSTKNKF